VIHLAFNFCHKKGRFRDNNKTKFEVWHSTGTQEIVAMEWFIIENNRISRRWGARDSASQFRQMEISMG
jgi:hypothetical protein